MNRISLSRAINTINRSEMMENIIAVCQMRSTEDKEVNWETCKDLMKSAKAGNAKMVFFPECFDYVATNRMSTIANACSEDSEYIGRFRSLARELKLWVSLGGFHETCKMDAGKIYITHLVLDADGRTVVKYRKLHLFDVEVPNQLSVHESAYATAGSELPKPVKTPIGSLFTSICYDMRFSELCRFARLNGAQLLSYPSAFTIPTGLAHWEVLLRSRAIDHQCYVVAAAQNGKHNEKRASYGHTMVVDPWGAIVAQCSSTDPTLCFANIDLNYLHTIRQRLPIYDHLRNDVYRLSFAQSDGAYKETDAPEVFKFGQKQIPNSCVFFATPLSYAFVNIKPIVEGHVLVTSRRCVKKLTNLDAIELSDMFRTAQNVQRALEIFYKISSSTVCVQDGPDAGQTVAHVHVHIIPRRKGDFARNDDVYTVLERSDKEMSETNLRSLEQMAQEANTYRELFSIE